MICGHVASVGRRPPAARADFLGSPLRLRLIVRLSVWKAIATRLALDCPGPGDLLGAQLGLEAFGLGIAFEPVDADVLDRPRRRDGECRPWSDR